MELSQFIRNYINLSSTELGDITSKFKNKNIKKNEFLLKEGEICNDLVFVQSGCLRMYYLVDGVEISVWFALKHTSAVEIHSFISQKPTKYYIQAIEDSEIYYLQKTELEKLYITHPKMQEMMRKYWEDVVLNLIDRFTALQEDSAEKRYRDLLNKPDYLKSIPQKYLASFIGVTPTSLSRIRKNIS